MVGANGRQHRLLIAQRQRARRLRFFLRFANDRQRPRFEQQEGAALLATERLPFVTVVEFIRCRAVHMRTKLDHRSAAPSRKMAPWMLADRVVALNQNPDGLAVARLSGALMPGPSA